VARDDAADGVGRVVVLDVVGLRPEHLDAGYAPNVADVLDSDSTMSL